MAREGIAQTTTRAITTEAGMARSSFHYCFQSKDELLEEMMRVVVGDMLSSAKAATTGDTLEEMLQQGFRGLWRSAIQNPDAQLVGYELTTYALHDESTSHLARRQYEDYYAQASEYLRFVSERADISWSLPDQLLAQWLVTVVDGLCLSFLAVQDDDLATAVLDSFAAYLASNAS